MGGARGVHGRRRPRHRLLSRVFDKLLLNFNWWVNLADAEGNNVFEGGFLGPDNIGPLDRSHLPVGGILEQSDATGWMGFYAVAMGAIASVLNRVHQRPASDLVLKFMEHFAAIRDALASQGLWDETDGLWSSRARCCCASSRFSSSYLPWPGRERRVHSPGAWALTSKPRPT